MPHGYGGPGSTFYERTHYYSQTLALVPRRTTGDEQFHRSHSLKGSPRGVGCPSAREADGDAPDVVTARTNFKLKSRDPAQAAAGSAGETPCTPRDATPRH
jgi:hypothetical protein